MDGDFTDSSINENDGVVSGAVFSSDAKIASNSAEFDGIDDSVKINNANISTTTTHAGWIRLSSLGTTQRIFGGCNDTNSACTGIDYASFSFYVDSSNKLGIAIGSDFSSRYILSSTTSISHFVTDQWYHVAATINTASDDIRLYINGELVPSADTLIGGGTIQSFSLDVSFGALYVNFNDSYVSYFDGLIDEFGAWNTVLSDSEIQALYEVQNRNYTGLSSSWTPQWNSLVGYWKMDGNWQDSSGNGNHGAAVGDATITTNSKIGSGAGDFDGSGDYITCDGSKLPSTTPLTMMTWAYIEDNGGPWTYLFQGSSYSSSDAFTLSRKNADKKMYYNDGGVQRYGPVVENDKWVHIAMVYNNVAPYIQIFIDGKEETIEQPSNALVSAGNHCMIGAYNSGTLNQEGRMDELAVWSSALTPSDISLIYNRQKQKYAGHYESPIINMGTPTVPTTMEWLTDLPFMKERPQASESSADYSALVGSTGNTSDNDLMGGIVGLWHFNDIAENLAPTGADFLDSSSSKHGVENGGIIFNQAGILSRSTLFDGADDYIEVTDHDDLTFPGSFSVSAWVKRNDITGDHTIVEKYDSTANQREFTFYTAAHGLVCHIYDSLRHGDRRLDAFYTWTKDWTHVTCVVNEQGQLSIYINGQKDVNGLYQGLGSFHQMRNTSVPLSIGGAPNGNKDYFNGFVDEFGIWSRELSPGEVSQLYRRGANRLKIQTRTCSGSSCSAEEEWQGPDNANGEFYFSELNNCTARFDDGTCDLSSGILNIINPNYTLSNFTNYVLAPKQYFQYRVLMESDDESGTPTFPSLTSINFGTKYFGGKPTVVTKTGHAFTSLSDFSVTISGTCTPKFQLGLGLTDWYYWNGSNWIGAVDTPADILEANIEMDISANISSFVADQGSGTLYVRVFLDSDTDQGCNIDEIKITE